MRKLKNEELNRKSIEEFKGTKKIPLVVILDNIRSMNNIGSAFRTADAFMVEKILLCGITAKPPHREIQKTALGATESVDWQYYNTTFEAVTKLKKEGYVVASVEQADKSTSLLDFIPEEGKKYAFVFGNEVFGVEDETVKASDICLEVPQFGTKHSLNISVCLGICIWDFFIKVRK
jgi:23S rRNA (guanosine2251-2'-O)-methyltransferase